MKTMDWGDKKYCRIEPKIGDDCAQMALVDVAGERVEQCGRK